jgi:hypothetical protein
MSLLQITTPTTPIAKKKQNKEIGHRIRVWIAMLASAVLVSSIAIYGASYYLLPIDQRPYSDKYELLRPSGSIGIKLGVLGTILFFIIFLYALRKVIPWLGRFGTARHWMDFHVIAGITAPILIAFHASFKFQGIAGFAFWIMLAVAISGVVGRYLYAQIPRSLNAAELSLTELHASEREFADALLQQSVFSAEQLARVLHSPTRDNIRRIGAFQAVGAMMVADLGLIFQVASLRRARIGFGAKLRSAGGFFSSSNEEVEQVVRLVRQKASLSRRVLFLDKTQKVFHLWHVIHRPFSYTFAILAIIHIVVVMGLGFAALGLR